ncbi:MAG: hypothetical protein O7F74_05870 [Bacteroidetes bacterium]|nr:hypothetical protein [Bacteroidota bacterium]
MPDTTRVGFDFVPLQVGDFRVYQVEEITKTVLLGFDTARFQLKESLVDSFPGQGGDIIYLLHRSKRLSANDAWELDSVWTARRNQTQAVTVESNVPFIKMVFPIDENKIWDGNKLNSADNDAYEMRNLFASFDTGLTIFEETLTVIQNEKLDSIDILDFRKEIYGLNIGLIYKNSSFLEFCDDFDCLGQKEIEQGRILKQTIIDYGKE